MANGNVGRATAVNIPTTVKTTFVTARSPQVAGQTQVGLNSGFANASGPSVLIWGTANVTPGTTTTSGTFSCIDEGGISVDLAQTSPMTAAVPNTFGFSFLDTRNDGIAHLYSIQLAQVAATANGTVNQAIAQATVTPG
jgi:hypothetical protein